MSGHLVVVRKLECFDDLMSYAGGSITLPAGSPMPDRSEGRSQTKCHSWSSRLGVGLGVNHPLLEKPTDYRNRRRPYMPLGMKRIGEVR